MACLGSGTGSEAGLSDGSHFELPYAYATSCNRNCLSDVPAVPTAAGDAAKSREQVNAETTKEFEHKVEK